MTDFERRLRAAMESAVANEQPPRNLVQQIRRRHRRHTARVAVAGTAAVAAVAVLVPVSIGVSGHNSGPAGRHRPTVYVAYPNLGKAGTIAPISIATNTPGKPILIGASLVIAITPDGKTVYAAALNKVVPISTAANTPGKPIRHVGPGYPREIVITP